jgi:hypothetical protein
MVADHRFCPMISNDHRRTMITNHRWHAMIAHHEAAAIVAAVTCCGSIVYGNES